MMSTALRAPSSTIAQADWTLSCMLPNTGPVCAAATVSLRAMSEPPHAMRRACPRDSSSQIGGKHLGVIDQFFGAAGVGDDPVFEHVRLLGDRCGDADVLLHQQDGEPALAQAQYGIDDRI